MENEFCPDCGAQVVHQESCEMCPCCGWSLCECNACNGKEEKDGVYTTTK